MDGHILVAEPNDQTREAICMFLEMAGIRTDSTSTARGALACLRKIPAIVVIDLLLPDGNALEIMRAIRDRGLSTDVAILAAGDDLSLLESAADVRPVAIFGKPVDFEDISDWLMTATTSQPLETHRVWRN